MKGHLITCHYCFHSWDPGLRCYVCPNCNTPYDPTQGFAQGFGGQIRAARVRMGLSQTELAKQLGMSLNTLMFFEKDKHTGTQKQTMMNRERLRIWVESTKPPLQRKREIEQMFKETENGRKDTQ